MKNLKKFFVVIFAMPKNSKYKAKKIQVDGISFDSKKEANRYLELKSKERYGEIMDLQLQVPFQLLPAQYKEETIRAKSGKEKATKRLVERKVMYVADFLYIDSNTGEFVVEDVKGYKRSTAYSVYVMKRKLMLYIHGIQIKEV